MGFYEAMGEFFKYLLSIGRSNETVNTYKKQLDRYYRYLIKKYNREIYIEDISSDDIESYLSDKRLELSSQSKKSIITAFKSMMVYCSNAGYCENVGLEVGTVTPRVKERISLTEEEVQALVDAITDPVVRCVVYTMYYTGARINELVQLTTDDIDLRKNIITIRKPKGHSHKSRIIPINHRLKVLLLEYLSIRLGGDTEDSFFVLKRSGGISADTVNRAIRGAAMKAEIRGKISCHTLRHTFSSLLQQRGVDLKRIQELLGHSNLDVTNTYLHPAPGSLRDAVSRMQ